ncbi:MAG: prolyl oligopeptidase family serine peptidase, partial [Bacteroidota bacterium]
DFHPALIQRSPLPGEAEDSTYKAKFAPQLLLDSVDFTINSFLWSPDGKSIAFAHQPDPLINTFFKRDISVYDVATETHRSLVSNPSFDGLIDWSPDSKSLLYSSSLSDSTSNYYRNDRYFRIDLDGNNNKELGAGFDENLNGLQWTPAGIFGTAYQKTNRTVIQVNPQTGAVKIVPNNLPRTWSLSFSDDGQRVAYLGRGDKDLNEVYLADLSFTNPNKLTDASKQISQWATSNSEVISWKSQDGAEIEGVLHKPQDYDPAKKYPLLVAIHGGPTGISMPDPVPSYVYPMVQWLNKGALILQPNYRGSAGYGEAFRSLNVRNLGVGDAWDVESGVDHLIERGLVDGSRVGSMGWSQGGYISAFLTTHSDKFKAISVGAGISNWMTYYVNTD